MWAINDWESGTGVWLAKHHPIQHEEGVAWVMDGLEAAYASALERNRLGHGTNVAKPQFEPHTHKSQ